MRLQLGHHVKLEACSTVTHIARPTIRKNAYRSQALHRGLLRASHYESPRICTGLQLHDNERFRRELQGNRVKHVGARAYDNECFTRATTSSVWRWISQAQKRSTVQPAA